MPNLVTKFTSFKKLIGGNREKTSFEYTFGMPQEEQKYVTMPNKWIRRIVGEIEFAIKLSAENQNKFDNEINSTLDYLTDYIKEEGVITKTVCQKAEDMLLSLASSAKEYKIILAAHAHIDMNWMWSFNETVAITLATFRTILNIMKQYPEFCFSQSQASVYKIVEDYDPDLMEEIKERIKEGRWEITATGWVETDKNMPNTESLLRHIKYTRDYLQCNWGIDPTTLEVDFSPDTFGHSGNVPEIDNHGRVKYYYHCRALDGTNALYRYKAPSGSEVLVYREQYWYNSGITPHIGAGLIDISKRSAGFKTGLIVYGVGDHGGGPTRRDVERAIEMMDWAIYPTIKFGTFHEFFKEAESVREMLPVVDHEMNYFAPGCYTTQSRIKLGNRRCEAALSNAEAVGMLASSCTSFKVKPNQLTGAWRDVLFTHFHDILTGSCVQDSREHAMGLYQTSMAVANTNLQNAMRVICENIDTSSIDEDIDCNNQSYGGGVGFNIENFTGVPNTELGSGKTRIFHVFNTTAQCRTEQVEVTVWDWVGDMRYVSLSKSDGTHVAMQLLDKEVKHYWDHKYFRFLAEVTVPALGYTTIVLNETDPEEYKTYYHPDNRSSYQHSDFVLENEYISAKFNSTNGRMYSLIDKETGFECIKQGETVGFNYIDTECKTSSAWEIGRHLKVEPIISAIELASVATGELQTAFSVKYNVKNSNITVVVSLDKHAKAVNYATVVDWHEIGGATIPLLNFSVPVSYSVDKYMYDVPASVAYREDLVIDVPALQYGMALNPNGKSVSVITNCKYGYRGHSNEISSTLINSSTNPDKYPERGIHHINLAVGVSESCPKIVEELATNINNKFCFHSSNSHKGSLPLDFGLVEFNCDTAVISAITYANDGELLVRFYENCGKSSDVTITLGKQVKAAQSVDLMENPVDEIVSVNGNVVSCKARAYSITTLKISI